MSDESFGLEGPGKDGTPAWAYCEDGYCVCCGNGRWKYHMPDCILRDALSALGELGRLRNEVERLNKALDHHHEVARYALRCVNENGVVEEWLAKELIRAEPILDVCQGLDADTVEQALAFACLHGPRLTDDALTGWRPRRHR